jgi:hypothetical protein
MRLSGRRAGLPVPLVLRPILFVSLPGRQCHGQIHRTPGWGKLAQRYGWPATRRPTRSIATGSTASSSGQAELRNWHPRFAGY